MTTKSSSSNHFSLVAAASLQKPHLPKRLPFALRGRRASRVALLRSPASQSQSRLKRPLSRLQRKPRPQNKQKPRRRSNPLQLQPMRQMKSLRKRQRKLPLSLQRRRWHQPVHLRNQQPMRLSGATHPNVHSRSRAAAVVDQECLVRSRPSRRKNQNLPNGHPWSSLLPFHRPSNRNP